MTTQILSNIGTVYNDEKLILNHKILAENSKINSHNHPQEIIFFNLVRGKVRIYLNKEKSELPYEEYELTAPQVLQFDGQNYISADILSESEIFIYLLKK